MIKETHMRICHMDFVKVDGEDCGDLTLYALSTCRWCKMTKELLAELNLRHRYVFVDQLDKEGKRKAMMEMEKHDPSGAFPLIVIDGKEVIKGFDEKSIRRLADK